MKFNPEQSAESFARLTSKFKGACAATFISLAALIGLFVYWNLTRVDGINWTIFIVQVVPLLALLPGLLTLHYRAFSWLCFVILMYFILAVSAAFKLDVRFSDLAFVALTVLIFVASMLASHWAQRVQKSTVSS